MNIWENLKKEQFACRDIPEIKISLIENDKIVYELILNSLVEYDDNFEEPNFSYLSFSIATINDKDFAALVSKKYDKYFIETVNYWRSEKDGKDHIITRPSQVFSNMRLSYHLDLKGEPTRWTFCFHNGWKNQ